MAPFPPEGVRVCVGGGGRESREKKGQPISLSSHDWRQRGRPLHQAAQLEGRGQQRAHVVGRRQRFQQGQQAGQFGVAVVVVPGLDGDAILQLEAKGLAGKWEREARERE